MEDALLTIRHVSIGVCRGACVEYSGLKSSEAILGKQRLMFIVRQRAQEVDERH